MPKYLVQANMVSATGTVTAKVTVLLTPEEIDAAAKMTDAHRPPGQ